MKRTSIIFALLILVSLTAFSQDPEFQYYKNNEIKTLLGRSKAGGGYISFTTGYSRIDNYHTILTGGRISWIANHSIGLGFGGTGFINEFHYEPSLDREVFLSGGYGGLYIEPIVLPRSPVHFSFPVLLGAGGMSFISKDRDFNKNFIDDSRAFLLIEPSAEIEINLLKYFRLSFGASYRFPTPFDFGQTGSYTIDIESLRTFSYMVTFKFGKF
jgi:hypothetical protein